MIKVSVIVPVYNVERYLEKCLNSIVNQTLKEIEIIIINDGSPDNSQQIIDKFAFNYPNVIKSFVQKNKGLGAARNYGITKASGEFISFVDSDDYIEFNMLELMYNKAILNNSSVVICGNNVVSLDYDIIKTQNVCDNGEDSFLLFNNVCSWNKIYKSKFFLNENIKFRTNVWYEDIDVSTKILLNNKEVSVVNKPLYNYLLRPESIMNNSKVEKKVELFLAFDEIISFLKEKKLYNKYAYKVEFLCIEHLFISEILSIVNSSAEKTVKIELISKFKNYMEITFPNFESNTFIDFLSLKQKIIFKLILKDKYFLLHLMFKIKKAFNL